MSRRRIATARHACRVDRCRGGFTWNPNRLLRDGERARCERCAVSFFWDAANEEWVVEVGSLP